MFPTIFHLGEQPVHWYPVLMAIAVIVGTAVVMYRGGQLGYDRAMLFDLCWWLTVAGLVGARLTFIIVDFEAQYYNACFSICRLTTKCIRVPLSMCPIVRAYYAGGMVDWDCFTAASSVVC